MGAEKNFTVWMQDVDQILSRAIGLTTQDLSDRAYRDWFDDGATAKEMAEEVLHEEGLLREDEVL